MIEVDLLKSNLIKTESIIADIIYLKLIIYNKYNFL